MNTGSCIGGAIAVFLSLSALSAQTATYSHSGATPAPAFGETDSRYPYVRFFNGTGVLEGSKMPALFGTYQSIQVSVDPSAPAIKFDQYRLTTQATTMTVTENRTVGFGQTASFTTTINFAPITLIVTEDGFSHPLSPAANGNYRVLQGTVGGGNLSFSGTLQGTYSISGPNETVSGSFSNSTIAAGYAELPDAVGTSLYPSSITLNNTYFFSLVASDPTLFEELVDGQNITAGLGVGSLYGITIDLDRNALVLTEGSLAAVPEPSNWGWFAGCLALVAAILRKCTDSYNLCRRNDSAPDARKWANRPRTPLHKGLWLAVARVIGHGCTNVIYDACCCHRHPGSP